MKPTVVYLLFVSLLTFSCNSNRYFTGIKAYFPQSQNTDIAFSTISKFEGFNKAEPETYNEIIKLGTDSIIYSIKDEKSAFEFMFTNKKFVVQIDSTQNNVIIVDKKYSRKMNKIFKMPNYKKFYGIYRGVEIVANQQKQAFEFDRYEYHYKIYITMCDNELIIHKMSTEMPGERVQYFFNKTNGLYKIEKHNGYVTLNKL